MSTWHRTNLALLLLLIVAARKTQQQQDATPPIVNITLGKIQGSLMKSQRGVVFYAFRGIPYAKPPLGMLRFAAPEPVEAWTETVNATKDGLICPQRDAKGLMTNEIMSEDCLTLNVYTRNPTTSSAAAVMVYIHGGANAIGSGHSQYEAGPHYLMDHEVVVVTFNYRLGALGFLTTKTGDAPGNYGYLDQVLALKWVQAHIANFGGNSKLVTLWGVSSGAMAVTLHMTSPLTKHLFHRAIAMSGSATNHFDVDNFKWTHKLANEVSCPLYNVANIISCLRNVSWSRIIDACAQWETYGFPHLRWNYEIDGKFLHAHPTNVFLEHRFHAVPLLVGITRDELDFTVYDHENNQPLLDDISTHFEMYAPEFFIYNARADNRVPTKSKRIRKFYLGNMKDITKENLVEFGKIFSDAIIRHGVHRLVELATHKVPVYYYRMDYVGAYSMYTGLGHKTAYTGHGDDLRYLFTGEWRGPQVNLNDTDMFMVDRLTGWWTHFAKYGKPQKHGIWEACKNCKIVTLFNNFNICLDDEPHQERYKFWDDMFPAGNAAANLKFTALTALLINFLIEFLSFLSNFTREIKIT